MDKNDESADDPFWSSNNEGQNVFSSVDASFTNRRAANSATGWRVDSTTGKKSYAGYSGGHRVVASGAEGFRLHLRDSKGGDRGGGRGGGGGGGAQKLDIGKDVQQSRRASSEVLGKGLHREKEWQSGSRMPQSSNLLSAICALPLYSPHWQPGGLGGGKTTRVLFNANNALDSPPAAPKTLVQPGAPPDQKSVICWDFIA